MRRRSLQIATAVVATLVALGVAEVGLRLSRSWASPADYGEVWGDGGLAGAGGYLRPGFSGRVRDGFGNTVRWVNNSVGFRRDDETVPERHPESLRVLSLGDSFAAGYRVGQEETYSYLLERHLESLDRWSRVEVLIAAIESPPIGLRYLQTEGVRWKPDLVLLGITLGNDLAQSFASLDPRGDLLLEAKDVETPVRANPAADAAALVADVKRWALPPRCFAGDARGAPRRESGQPRSGLLLLDMAGNAVRERRLREAPQAVMSLWGRYERPLLFDNNGIGLFTQPAPPRIRSAHRRLFSILQAYRNLCAARGFRFAVALFPQRFQVQARDWEATVEAYGLSPECFDLTAPNRRIGSFCRDAGVPCIDPTEGMRRRFEEAGRSLYLPRGDMHWNALGHRAAYEAMRDPLSSLVADVPGPRDRAR